MEDGDTVGDRILKLSPPTVTVALPGDHDLILRGLTGRDLDFLQSIRAQAPNQFIKKLLAHQVKEPRGGESILQEQSGATLLRVARKWAAMPSTLELAPSKLRSYEDFRSAVLSQLEEWERPIKAMGQRLAASIGWLDDAPLPELVTQQLTKVEAASRALARIAEVTQRTSRVLSRFRAGLPDYSAIRRALEEADEGHKHLEEHGYGFATFDMTPGGLRLVAREQPDSREVHRMFREYTRGDAFSDALLGRFRRTEMLRRRAPIVRQVVWAHQERNYGISIPALYAQIEGTLTDLLVAEGSATRRGRKAFRSGTDSELWSLGSKVKEYARADTVMRKFVTQEMLQRLSPDRNGILHGTTTGYLQAKRSVRLLLILDALSHVVEEAEQNRKKKTEV